MTIAMIVGKALSPFFALILIWGIAAPIRRRVQRMPDCRLKRVLLMRTN